MKARVVIGAFLLSLVIAVIASDSTPLQALPDAYIGLIGTSEYIHQVDESLNTSRPLIAPAMSVKGFITYPVNDYLTLQGTYSTYANEKLYEVVTNQRLEHIDQEDFLSASQVGLEWNIPLQKAFNLSGNGDISIIKYQPNYRGKKLGDIHDALMYSFDTKLLSDNGLSVWVGWSQIDDLNGLDDDLVAIEVEEEI